MLELRCGRRWYCWPFGALFVYAGPAFPGGFRLLWAMDFGRAVSAVFCPPRASKDARAADFAAAKSFWVEDGCGRRSMGSSLYIFTLLCDELCVRWVVQRDEGGLSLPFFKYQRRKNVPAFEKAGTSRSADIGIWENSKHSRCPDTRRFWEYPKPFAFGSQPYIQEAADHESFSGWCLLSS